MDASNLSLLFAIAVPVGAVAALHVWLALNGENGTLLLPAASGGFNLRTSQACVLGAIVKAAARVRLAQTVAVHAANDASFRVVA